MNIKKRNFMVTALGSLMVMGTLFSPLSASATSASTPAVKVINIADGASFNLADEVNFDLTDAITIEPMTFDEMMKSFEIKPSAKDKKQMKTYFDQAEKLDKAGKYDEAMKIWEKFDKILGKYVDFSKSIQTEGITIEAVEINSADSSKIDLSEIKNISEADIEAIMKEIEAAMK